LRETTEEGLMKQLNCREAGFDCQGVITGETEQEVMSKAAEHAREAHGITEVDEELGAKLRGLIRDV
jgi:predicted small metal-binding protein